MAPAATLMKGFLPVRLRLSEDDETFFFVKEHQSGKNDSKDDGKKNKTKLGCTLFVANAPVIPGVSTKLALRSLLGRYADIARVTVVPNPRIRRRPNDTKDINGDAKDQQLTVESLALWSDKITMPTFLPPIYCEGKYAHVVFSSPKGLKRTMQELHRIMSAKGSKGKEKSTQNSKRSKYDDSDSDSDHDDGETTSACLTMERLEIQTLADETASRYEQQERKRLGKPILENEEDESDDNFDDYDDDGNEKKKKKSKASKKYNKDGTPVTGVLAVAQRYRQSSQALSRAELLAECNRVMQEYEEAEEAKRKAHQQAKEGNMVDDDGFVTVSYSSNTTTAGNGNGIHNLLEESITTTTTSHSRRNAPPRRRNNKKKSGTSELRDFYRFQRKEHKKRTLDQLRTQFEEDLRKIKKLKQEHQYRPF